MKRLFYKSGSFTKLPLTSFTGNVTIDTNYNHFNFGVYDNTNRIILSNESAYDDVYFSVNVRLSGIGPTSIVGISLSTLTDANKSEKPTFRITDNLVTYSFLNDVVIASQATSLVLTNKIYNLTLRRTDDTYYLYVDGVLIYSILRLTFKQNVGIAITGANFSLKILNTEYYTTRENVKFLMNGDSMSNGSALGVTNTVKGRLHNMGILSLGESCGDANVVKDTQDVISEIIAINPQYCIIMYGPNDISFATGNLLTGIASVISQVSAVGIIPIVCTMVYRSTFDYYAVNTTIRDAFFASNLNIELEDAFGPADVYDGVHPTVIGTQKVADRMYPLLSSL